MKRKNYLRFLILSGLLFIHPALANNLFCDLNIHEAELFFESDGQALAQTRYLAEQTEGFTELRLGTTENRDNFFKTEGLKKGDQVTFVTANRTYKSRGGYPDSAYSFLLASDSVLNPESSDVLFKAYDFVTGQEKVLKFSYSEVRNLWIKRPKAVEQKLLSNDSVIAQLQGLGYDWLGQVPDYHEVYQSLRPGDEVVFQDLNRKPVRYLVRNTKLGQRTFLNLDQFNAGFFYSNVELYTNPFSLTPAQLQAMVKPGSLVVKRTTLKWAKAAQDPDWQSQVQQIASHYQSVQNTVANINLTQLGQTNPQAAQSIVNAGQIAYAQNAWRIANIDIRNIRAIRDMNENPPYYINRVSTSEITKVNNDHYYLDVDSIVGKNLTFDTWETFGIPHTRQAKISISDTDPEVRFFEVAVSSKEEGVKLYAHLLESAYGHVIETARHVNHLDDVRMNMRLYESENILGSKMYVNYNSIREPNYLGEITASGSGDYRLRIKFYNDVSLNGLNSEFILGLLWAHNLR